MSIEENGKPTFKELIIAFSITIFIFAIILIGCYFLIESYRNNKEVKVVRTYEDFTKRDSIVFENGKMIGTISTFKYVYDHIPRKEFEKMKKEYDTTRLYFIMDSIQNKYK